MATRAGDLSEPAVLASAKRRLFPDDAEGYAVVDTQFAADEWLEGVRIEPALRDALAPFNHVRVAGGYPDLIGVGDLDDALLAVDRLGDGPAASGPNARTQPPLVAVEAKGETADGGVDTNRGILQAYDRLHEANAAYLAAPATAVSQTDRTMARELNVGILGVDADGAVEALVVPRVVGARTTDEAAALRFQASAQGVADQSFSLNHPKNYLGYVLAHAAPGDTAALCTEYVVGATDGARRGALFLGLLEATPRGDRLTSLGEEVVRFALRRHGSAEQALQEFAAWQGSTGRFADVAPAWGQLARRVVYDYPATELLVTELQQCYRDGVPEPTLVDLVTWLHETHPTFAVELFVRGDDAVRSRVLDADGELRPEALTDGEIYHSPTVFQLKAMLYHAGLLRDRGAEPHRLDPTADVWALRDPVPAARDDW